MVSDERTVFQVRCYRQMNGFVKQRSPRQPLNVILPEVNNNDYKRKDRKRRDRCTAEPMMHGIKERLRGNNKGTKERASEGKLEK